MHGACSHAAVLVRRRPFSGLSNRQFSAPNLDSEIIILGKYITLWECPLSSEYHLVSFRTTTWMNILGRQDVGLYDNGTQCGNQVALTA